MQFKAIFFIAATLIAAGLLGVELNLLARGRAAVRLLEQENRQQETGNDHLAGEIEGLRVSKPRIDALYSRLSDTMIASRGTSSLHINSIPTAPLNSENSSFESAGLAGITPTGPTVPAARVPNSGNLLLYLARVPPASRHFAH